MHILVYVLSGPAKELFYGVPREMRGRVFLGSLVRVPLMRRACLGVVVRMVGEDEMVIKGMRLRNVQGVVGERPVLTEDLLKLAAWMEAYYGASRTAIFEAMIPSEVRREQDFKYDNWLQLTEAGKAGSALKRAPKQAAICAYLRDASGACAKAEVLEKCGVSAEVVNALIEKGLIEVTKERRERENVYQDALGDAERVVSEIVALTDEQTVALQSILGSLGEYKTHLLHGVTGSGKTEVYLRALKAVLERGGGALFLVPEVALTAQTVGRLRAQLEPLGIKSVVWHSALSAGERFDSWMSILNGEARVVVGARSAVFAPVKNLQLIVVDEEHEPSFKQSDSPRYSARDVAVYRAFLSKSVCVLGSATPSLESIYNAQTGKYVLNKLTKRVDHRQLPLVHVVDLRAEKRPGMFSKLLVEKIFQRFENREQTILFVNRRGYASSMVCPDCGFTAFCPHCSISLTLHQRDNAGLRCHMCGFSAPAWQACPQCKSEAFKGKRFGTQRAEDILKKLLPMAKIARIDADNMQQKDLLRTILADFRVGKIDILVGTQIIAKGLDFPNVTLVGLLEADLSLHLPDFRANERTFQLVVQVAGRAGRGDRAGEVVVQTFLPNSDPVQFARHDDFDGFFQHELESRKTFSYPPYRHVIRQVLKSRNREQLEIYANHWAKTLEENLLNADPTTEMRGPAPAPIEKIRGFYRFHIWFFTNHITRFVKHLDALRAKFPIENGVEEALDVDPVDLM